jgi:hypothetical protein
LSRERGGSGRYGKNQAKQKVAHSFILSSDFLRDRYFT